jgi:hypothetical protein
MSKSAPAKIAHVYVDEDGDDGPPLSAQDHAARARVANNPLSKLNKASTGLGRAEIVAAFTNAFEMIGGLPRLAVWGDANPTEFYKLYAKLLPSSSTIDMTAEQTITVRHKMARPHDYKADITDATTVGDPEDE